MIGLRAEYEKMFRVERQLWWYRHLHERVLAEITNRFGTRRDLKILDAGCGTGGLLDFLRQRGYAELQGIDGSADAVAFCLERGLPVDLVDLTQLSTYRSDEADLDIIVCNDVFCYFDEIALPTLLHELARRLKPGGLFLSNNNAFAVFRGEHDLAVGSMRRFVRADFSKVAPAAGLKIQQSMYWSFLLSPLILAVRQWQALTLRLKPGTDMPASDIDVPAAWLNEALYRLVQLEGRLLPRTPFGSSLFLTMTRN